MSNQQRPWFYPNNPNGFRLVVSVIVFIVLLLAVHMGWEQALLDTVLISVWAFLIVGF